MLLNCRFLTLLLLLIGLAAVPHAAPGQTDIAVTDAVASRVTSSHLSIVPGQTFELAWEFRLEPHWHIYWQNAGDSGIPPQIVMGNPAFQLGETQWPTPKVISMPPITNYGYEDHLTLLMPITAPKVLQPGELAVPLRLEYLYCKDICLPGKVDLTLPLTVAAAPEENPVFPALAAQNHETLPRVLPSDADVRAFQKDDRTYLVFNDTSLGAVAPRFIPDKEGWLDDSAEQTSRHRDGYLELTLPHDAYSNQTVTAVKGLLLRADGTGFMVDAPLDDAPAAVQDVRNTSLMTVLVLAFLAGLILNLMPCVLPVIALKVFALMRTRNHTERLMHTLVYAAGVLVTFWGMGTVIALLQQGGQKLGWGFQMQNPYFVAGLAALMLALAMNFWGVFKTGAWLTRVGVAQRGEHESYAEAFLTGLVAVVVATPCTVPFMGTAMAYALGQSFAGIVQVFTALGLGMVAPLALVALFPPFSRLLPRPGAWMETFKQFLGWPLLLTALWLVWVFAGQGGTAAVFVLLILLLAFAFALWLYGLDGSYRGAILVGAVLAAGAWLLPMYLQTNPAPSAWQPWSAEATRTSRLQNVPVFVDFTADWCITCKFTEATVLNTTAVQALFAKHHTVLLKGDWTSYNPDITTELARHGRRGVPLYLLYLPGNEEPLVLPQLLTLGVLRQALEDDI